MPDQVVPWSPIVRIPSTIAHVIGILTTILRLLYRWYLSRLWWEDTWAALALICDTGCLASVWMWKQENPAYSETASRLKDGANWLISLTTTSTVWFARISILCSIVRIANPSQKLRSTAYCTGGLFLVMQAGLLAQKIYNCVEDLCRISRTVAIAQLVTDVIADVILVAIPIRFLRGVKLSRDRRVLILSAFSASLLISAITIFHSILLFNSATTVTMMIGYLKAAFSLFVCNALVLVTCVYRLFHKSAVGPGYSMAEGCGADTTVEFTSVIDLPSKLSSRSYPVMSGIQGKGNTTQTMALTLDTSVGLG